MRDRDIPRAIARQAGRERIAVAVALAGGFVFGVAYRTAFDPVSERSPEYFVLSGLHGAGLAMTIWLVQAAFAHAAHAPLGLALKRLPLGLEVLVRAVATTAALVVVGLLLQALIYAGPQHLDWFRPRWFAVELPRIVGSAFALSLVIGLVGEAARLIGAPLLTSLVLGTYHRPARRNLIVMFLDIAHSTRLAETLGEVRVHDLITRFFFDIDEPIAEHGGTVHAYVGDEVIVSWPIAKDPARNARAVACFFAIERKMAALAADYEAEFGVAPSFRAGVHAGPVVVSECGGARRQLAFFGDTMNVAARLCEHCKTIGRRLVISGEVARLTGAAAGVVAAPAEPIRVRGREAPVEALVVEAAPGAAAGGTAA